MTYLAATGASNGRIFFRRPDGSEGPNLGYIGFVVIALVTAHLAARFMCVAVIVLAFGRDAYFVDGLRVADWKHSTLSDGSELALPWNFVLGVGTFLIWVALVVGIEYAAGVIRHRVHRWCHPTPQEGQLTNG
jgi:hypothetical protein